MIFFNEKKNLKNITQSNIKKRGSFYNIKIINTGKYIQILIEMESERKKKTFSVLDRIENLPKQSEFFNWQLTKSKKNVRKEIRKFGGRG